MKFYASLFLTFLFSVIGFAQTTVSGRITDSDGQPVPSASVTIEEQGKDAIMAFSISNSKGEYKVTFTSPEPNVDLKIKAFNQKPVLKSIKNTTQNHVQKWWFSVNKFPVYAYVKIDMKLPIKRPDLKSGMYEQIYFTTNTNDFSGISQKQT